MSLDPRELAKVLQAQNRPLVHLFRLHPKGQAVIYRTDQSEPLSVADQIYEPKGGWRLLRFELHAHGHAQSVLEIKGAWDEALGQIELQTDLLCDVDLYLLPPHAPVPLGRFVVQEMVRLREASEGADQGLFLLKGLSLIERLDRPLRRLISRQCDARLGDARCGLRPDQIQGRTCDKHYSTCRLSFDNGHRFRGFPDLLGEDYFLSYPQMAGSGAGAFDGGSRKGRR